MSDRYMKSDLSKKIMYKDATNIYGHSMTQSLPFDENKTERIVCLEEMLNNPENSDIGNFIEVEVRYRDIIKEKTMNFPFLPWK